MFAWMVVIVLGAEVFNTQYVVGRGNVGKQRRNNQPHTDDMQPRRYVLGTGAFAKRHTNRGRYSDKPQHEPHHVQRCFKLQFLLP